MARVRKAQRKAAEASRLVKWLTAIYIRLSKEDGNDESYSVTNQKQRLIAYFESIALEESMQLVDVYVDDGFTGTDSNRDGFQRLLQDLDEGRINCIIVKDLSRLSRNDWECKRYLQHLFVVKDIRFISLELPRLDSYQRPDEIYDLGVTMQSAYNENHCRETSIKIRGTFNAKRRAGEFIGAFAPYGYLKDPTNKHKFVVDETAAQVVRDIFHWFVREGMSKTGIVKKLIGLGIPCPTAYKWQNGMNYNSPVLVGEPQWSSKTISLMLENQMYLGHMVQGKQKVKSYKVHTRVAIPEDEWFIVHDMHEPIIDQATFDQAKNLMLRDTRTPPNSGKLYPFSGFLRCVDCEKSMMRRCSKSRVYYACRTNQTTGLCTRHSIRHDRLETLVLTAITRQIDLIDGLSEIIDSINAAPVQRTTSKRLDSSLKSKRNEFEKTKVLYEGLYMDLKSGVLSMEAYQHMKQRFEEKQVQLKQDISNLEEEIRDMAQGVTSQNPYFEIFRKHRTITELTREIVVDLIEVIHIHEGGDVDIAFNFADQHRRAVEFVENNQGPELELVRMTG